MHVDWWTLVLQTVNFVVLVWLLHRFLYRPVLRLMDARKAELQRQLDQVRALEDRAKSQVAAADAERAAIGAEREAALKAATAQAQEAARTLREQAEHEAQALLAGAHEAVTAERERVLEEARRIALDLGAQYARRLLAEVPVALRAEAWIGRIEQHLQALPKSQLEPLARQFQDGGVLTVTTAAALPPATADTWRGRLAQTLGGGGAHIVFEVNPELIAGAELHFPTAVLSFSWQSALAALRTKIAADGHAH